MSSGRLVLLSVFVLLAMAHDVAAHDMHGAMAKPGGYASPMIAPNATWSMTFDPVGPSAYHCHPHPFMTGMITVDYKAPAATAVTVHIAGFVFEPAALHIRPGTNVTWINHDAVEHTVTESMIETETTTPPAQDAPSPGFATFGTVMLALLVLVRRQR